MKEKLSVNQITDWLIVLVLSGLMGVLANILGYEGQLMGSLVGIMWLIIFTFVGVILKEIMPGNLPAVAYISLIAIICAMPSSPISERVITDVTNISLLALCTPILSYAGVTIGKDWPAFKRIGYKGIIVSLIVILGTVLACVVFSEVLFRIF